MTSRCSRPIPSLFPPLSQVLTFPQCFLRVFFSASASPRQSKCLNPSVLPPSRVTQTFFYLSLPPQPLTAPALKPTTSGVLNRSHGNRSTNQRQSRQRAEVHRTPLRRGQVRFPLQRPETRHRRRLHRHPRPRSPRVLRPPHPLPTRAPPSI